MERSAAPGLEVTLPPAGDLELGCRHCCAMNPSPDWTLRHWSCILAARVKSMKVPMLDTLVAKGYHAFNTAPTQEGVSEGG